MFSYKKFDEMTKRMTIIGVILWKKAVMVSRILDGMETFFRETLADIKKSSTFASEFRKELIGVVVQLVRIPACHAGGRGFESRPYRRGESNIAIQKLSFLIAIFVLYTIAFIATIVYIVYIVYIVHIVHIVFIVTESITEVGKEDCISRSRW